MHSHELSEWNLALVEQKATKLVENMLMGFRWKSIVVGYN